MHGGIAIELEPKSKKPSFEEMATEASKEASRDIDMEDTDAMKSALRNISKLMKRKRLDDFLAEDSEEKPKNPGEVMSKAVERGLKSKDNPGNHNSEKSYY